MNNDNLKTYETELNFQAGYATDGDSFLCLPRFSLTGKVITVISKKSVVLNFFLLWA